MKRILIPVDGSRESLEGIRLFKDLNVCAANEIHILNVQALTIPFDEYFTSNDKNDLLTYLRNKGADILSEAKEMLAGQPYTEMVLIGDPVTEIIDYAKKNNIDMIVVGSHGKSGLNAVLLGSVTSKLLAYSHIPVLVTRPTMKEREYFKSVPVNSSVD